MDFKLKKQGNYHTGGIDECSHEFADRSVNEEEMWSDDGQEVCPQFRKRKHGKKRYHLGAGNSIVSKQNVINDNHDRNLNDTMETGGVKATSASSSIDMEQASNPEEGKKKATVKDKIFHECCALFCPFALIFRAICQCDMELLCKLCSSLFVIKAMWSSILILYICNLFKVHRIIPNFNDDILGSTTNRVESYTFGLWSYTEKIERTDHSFIHALENDLKEIESCRFHMNRVDIDAPEMLFLNDAAFTFVRVIACMVVGIGFFSTILVWLNAANYCTEGRLGSLAPMGLLSCAVLECFVFVIFGSSVCRDSHIQEQRYCTLQEGSGLIFASIFSWLISFIGKVMVDRYSGRGETAILLASSMDELHRTHSDLYLDEEHDMKSGDLTFDGSSDDSEEDGRSSPSQFVIS